jgi:transcriptional regulator with XRE-family HTH domain
LGVNPSTVSKWCTNSSQPPLEILLKITELFDVDIKELIRFEERDKDNLFFIYSHHRQGVDKSASGIEIFNE